MPITIDPTITRATEEMLLLVPHAIREAALGLGSRSGEVRSPSLCGRRCGVVTGLMLAFARVAGETAPLLFTAFGNQYWSTNPISRSPRFRADLRLRHFTV